MNAHGGCSSAEGIVGGVEEAMKPAGGLGFITVEGGTEAFVDGGE